jgi:hypothetical protein
MCAIRYAREQCKGVALIDSLGRDEIERVAKIGLVEQEQWANNVSGLEARLHRFNAVGNVVRRRDMWRGWMRSGERMEVCALVGTELFDEDSVDWLRTMRLFQALASPTLHAHNVKRERAMTAHLKQLLDGKRKCVAVVGINHMLSILCQLR